MSLEDIDDLEYSPVLGDYQVTYHGQIHRGMKSLKTLAQTNDSTVVKISGDQTISNTKTFSDAMSHNDFEWIPITSPGFEIDGHWSNSGSVIVYDDTVVHSGTRSYRITGGATIRDGISAGDNYFPVIEGELYYAEAWIKWDHLTIGSAGTAISLGATIVRDIGGNTYPSFWNLVTSTDREPMDWFKISGVMTIPAGATGVMQIRPSVRTPVVSGNVWFDDIKLARITPATNGAWALSRARAKYYSDSIEDLLHPGQEIELINQDFDSTGGWTVSTPSKVIDNTRSFEGTSSMKIIAAGPAANISEVTADNRILVSAGEQYYAECYVWWEDIVHESGIGIALQCSVHNSGGTQIAIPQFKTTLTTDTKENSKEWVKLAGTITIPANAYDLRMRVATREGVTAGTVWFDRVRLRKLANQSTLYYRGDKRWKTLDKTLVDLSNVDNTSDANKPTTTAETAALATKQDDIKGNLVKNGSFEQDSAYWTVNNLSVSTEYAYSGTKSMKYTAGTALGEAWIDPISVSNGEVVTAECMIYHDGTGTTGQGLRLQARQISNGGWVQVGAAGGGTAGAWLKQTLSYTVDGALYDAVRVRLGFNATKNAWVDNIELYKSALIDDSKYLRGDKTFQTLSKSSVALSNVDNTSDANKPISTATQTALNLKQSSISSGETYQYYRGDKTWQTLNSTSVGLGNVNNTSDADKPVSTATQSALDDKANIADTVLLTGAQTIAGIKTFSTSPKIGGTTTIGYVWKATSADGSGSWQDIGELVTTVDWDNVTGKPSTFAPTIGSTADTAAAGNHTHTKTDIGLGNVDNTSDLGKPVSTATQSALNTKVATTRTFSTSSHFTGGGDLSANRTVAIDNGGIGLGDLDDSTKKTGIAYIQTLDTRAVGLGQIEDGFEFPFAVTITSVKYRMGTADASGTTTCEIRKNGVAVSGTSGTASTSPTAVTGSWSFAAGDKLTIYTTAVGTTPGKRLTAEMVAILA